MDITQIPKTELITDRAASLADIAECNKAISLSIHYYSGGSVKERLEVNQGIVDKIDIEILRRMEGEGSDGQCS